MLLQRVLHVLFQAAAAWLNKDRRLEVAETTWQTHTATPHKVLRLQLRPAAVG